MFTLNSGVYCGMSEGDSEGIMVNQFLSCDLVIFSNIRGQASPGTESIKKVQLVPISKVIGTCMVPVANKVTFGLATDTGIFFKRGVNCKFGCEANK